MDSQWILVRSSVVRAVRYEPASRRLLIRFVNGTKFAYADVPREVFEELLEPAGGSTGRYFGDHVRDVYDYEELT